MLSVRYTTGDKYKALFWARIRRIGRTAARFPVLGQKNVINDPAGLKTNNYYADEVH
jgi:hypothetical protein